MKNMDWRNKSGDMTTKRMGGIPAKNGQTVVRGQTKPASNFMGGGSGPYTSVNLSAFANRRCGHKGSK